MGYFKSNVKIFTFIFPLLVVVFALAGCRDLFHKLTDIEKSNSPSETFPQVSPQSIQVCDDSDPEDVIESDSIAVQMTGDILPSEDLSKQVCAQLQSIRRTFDQTIKQVEIRFRPIWALSEIVIGFDEATFDEVQNGSYHAWDDLNGKYQIKEINLLAETFFAHLTFENILHPRRLAELYENLPGVELSVPNYLLGDGHRIFPRFTANSLGTYLFNEGRGDCPSGCIKSEYWYFTFTGDTPTFVGHWNPSQDPSEPSWWEEAKKNVGLYESSF